MAKLEQVILQLRQELPKWRGKSIKEKSTCMVFIEPLLEALGWDTKDLNEMEPEYTTVDGKQVDYALKITGKPALYLEAKPLDDDLKDLKAITQIVNYANADGLDWSVLTNGVRYQVYRSSEKVPAPDKLLFECSLDPKDNPGVPIEEIARMLSRLSKEAIAEGKLDSWGKAIFTDMKIRKSLEQIFMDPPRALLNLVRTVSGDPSLQPKGIRESFVRIWQGTQEGQNAELAFKTQTVQEFGKAKVGKGVKPQYSLEQHIQGKPQATVELFHRLDGAILAFAPGGIQKQPRKHVINYLHNGKIFCGLHILKSSLRIWVKLRYEDLARPPDFVRDVSKIGHWGVGETEIDLSDEGQLQAALQLIRDSFEKRLAANVL